MKQPNLTPEQWQQFNMLQTIIKIFSPNPAELRSTNEQDGGCYYMTESKPESPGCAIGCFISWKNAAKLDKIYEGGGPIYDAVNENPHLFPKWMLGMNVDFLKDVQLLHDRPYYWADKGLTQEGKEAVAVICNHYFLPYELIEW